MKTLIAIVITLSLLGCSNIHDARIAEAEASIEVAKEVAYAKGIEAANEPKVLVRIDGEVRCTPEMIAASRCGTTFYNPNAQNVVPERDKNWVDGVKEAGDFVYRTITAYTPLGLAKEVRGLASDISDNTGDRNSNNTTVHEENSSVVKNDTQTTTVTKNAGKDLLENSSKDESISNHTTTNTTTSVVENNSTNSSNNPRDSNDNNSTTQLPEPAVPTVPTVPVEGL